MPNVENYIRIIYEVLQLKQLGKIINGYEGVGIITLDIIKCLTTQKVKIRQKKIPADFRIFN